MPIKMRQFVVMANYGRFSLLSLAAAIDSNAVDVSNWECSALPTKRRQIKQLVDEGRLEFTSGTWVMTDEATPHLYSILDQMIEGD